LAAKLHPYTTKLYYDADGADPYTELTDLIECTPPNTTSGDCETTHLSSAGAAREYIAGWIEGGVVPFAGYFAKTQFTQLRTMLTGRLTWYFRITLPLLSTETTPSKVECQGHVHSIAFDQVTIDDNAIRCPFEMKVTGLPTFTAGS